MNLLNRFIVVFIIIPVVSPCFGQNGCNINALDLALNLYNFRPEKQSGLFENKLYLFNNTKVKVINKNILSNKEVFLINKKSNIKYDKPFVLFTINTVSNSSDSMTVRIEVDEYIVGTYNKTIGNVLVRTDDRTIILVRKGNTFVFKNVLNKNY